MGIDASKDFFISYTSADQHWAEWIAWQLEAAGYTTILQAWDFHAGGNFVLDMDRATKQAKRTIAVLSPDYLDSRFTPSEWATAFRRDPKGEQGLLVPVRVRPCDVEGLLGPIVYIDLIDQDEQAAQAILLARVKRERHKPTSAPTFPSVTRTLPERPSFPGALPPIWNIPYPPNPYFTGREELLSQLAAALRAGKTTALSQPQAISGLGGIGKTQRLHLSMPTATTRTIRLCYGAVLIQQRPLSLGSWRLQNCSNYHRKMRETSLSSLMLLRTG